MQTMIQLGFMSWPVVVKPIPSLKQRAMEECAKKSHSPYLIHRQIARNITKHVLAPWILAGFSGD